MSAKGKNFAFFKSDFEAVKPSTHTSLWTIPATTIDGKKVDHLGPVKAALIVNVASK